MKMSNFSGKNNIPLILVAFSIVCSVCGQDQRKHANLFLNDKKPVNGIEQIPASLSGSRVKPRLMDDEFTTEVSERSQLVGETNRGRNSIYGNNMEYYSQMTPFKQNREINTNFSLTSKLNRKKVKMMHNMKTSLLNIPKNVSSSWHGSNHRLRSVEFSNGNITGFNSEPMEFSRMNKITNLHNLPKELKSNQNTFNQRDRTSASLDKIVENGAIDLKGNPPSNSISSLHINDPVKALHEYSGTEASIPCSCFWSEKKCGCRCNDSLIYDDFQQLSKAFRPCLNFTFTITGGHHFSLPPNLFTQIGKVQTIHLKITNATFDYLFDATPYSSAFRGVSFENAALIEILGVRVRRGWNWTPLQYLNSSSGAGVEIKLEGCGLKRLSSDFGRVADGKVITARISNSRLEMIGSGAFSSFNDLTHFELPRNRLRSIKRTDLPVEPLNLIEIDLRNNLLQSLEADLFTEMPSLQIISLAGNPLRVLPEATFSSVIDKASVLGLSDFPLHCDCRLRWLKDSTFTNNDVVSSNLKGMVCKRPPHLRGTPFKDLAKEHLMC